MMNNYEKLTFLTYEHFWSFGVILSFILGSCIGSFLNVCIWRIPRGENLSHPGSHCPKCNYQIPPYFNIPILAWLVLGGKCKNCRDSISPRYIIIEAFTGLLFIGITWQARQLQLPIETLLTFYFLAATFITIIFIDIAHLIIPATITRTGFITALAFAVILPYTVILPETHQFWSLRAEVVWLSELHPLLKEYPRLLSLTFSLSGMIMGYAILWSVVELGKAIFGKQTFKYDEAIAISLNKDGATAAGDELLPWDDIFDRPTDVLTIHAEDGIWKTTKEEGVFDKQELTFKHDGCEIDGKQYSLEEIDISVNSKHFIVPREAMGRGDIKMLSMIGAFLGPAGVIFSLMIAAISGSVIGLCSILLGKFTKNKQMPFGPFLAIAAALWMLCWPQLVQFHQTIVAHIADLLAGFI